MASRKSRSGPTQPEGDRVAKQFKLRLSPAVAAEIRATAAEAGLPVSTLVALAWAVARRSGGLATALELVARADAQPR